MSFKKIKPTTMNELTMNVFMLMSEFAPETFNFSNGIDGTKIIASTTGGVTFADTPEYMDFGEDIDNCPKNTMELKLKKDGEVKVSGNLVTVNVSLLKMLIGAATITGNKVVPKADLSTADFTSLWGLADYGDGGLIAIKMKRVLNTSGISISTTDDAKAQFAFEFTCHKTIENLTDAPYEIYILENTAASGGVELNTHSTSVAVGSTVTLTATTVPSSATVTWSSASTQKATVSGGVVTGVAAGNTIITASITVDGVTYSDTCTVVVEAGS